MQNTTLMLNNLFLEEIIKAKLILPTNESLLTETKYTTGTYDLATISKNIGWTESMGTPWTWPQAVSALKALGAEPFACSAGGNNRYLLSADQKAIETNQFAGKTDIGYQVLLYTKEIGTLLRFYKDLTMHSTGMTDNQWGWTLKNGKIYLQYETKAYANQLMHDEGYLQKQLGRVSFVDTAKPALISNKETEKKELAATLQYAAKNSWVYGSSYAPTGYWQRVLDRTQFVFDFLGIVIPPIDIVNAVIYILRDRYLEAFISVLALIPGVGDALNLIFKGIFRAIGGVGKFIGRTAINSYKSVFKAIFKQFPKVAPETLEALMKRQHNATTAALKKLASSGVITNRQYLEYMQTVDEQLELIQKAVTELEKESAGKLAREKLMKNPYISKALFGKSAAVLDAVEPSLGKLFLKAMGKGSKWIVAAFAKIVVRSKSSIISVYKKLLQKFMLEMSTNPKVLAMVSASFADKTIIETILASKLGSAEMQALARQYPRYFKTTVTRVPYGGTSVVVDAINIKYLGNILTKLGTDSKIYTEIGVEVFEKLSRGATNYFWDLYRTNPFRNIMARATNPVKRFAEAIPGWGTKFWPSAGNWLSFDFFPKQLDVIYNEIIKYREIQAGQPDLSKNSLYVALLYEWGVFDEMDEAQKKIEANQDYKFIRAVTKEEGGYKPFNKPGSTDSTTFQNWSKSLDPAIAARYQKALNISDNATKGVYAKQAYKDIVAAVAGLGTNIRGVKKAIENISNGNEFKIFLDQFKDGKTGYSNFNDMINGEYGVANYNDLIKLVRILKNKLPGWTIKYNPIGGGLLGNTFKGGFEIYKK